MALNFNEIIQDHCILRRIYFKKWLYFYIWSRKPANSKQNRT